MSIRTVGVHGVGNHRAGLDARQAALRLGAEWTGHLTGTGLPIDLRIAYYAPFLHTTAQAVGDGLDDLPPRVQDMLVAWAGHLGALPADTPQAAWSIPARLIVDRVARRENLDPILLRRFVAVFLGEVDRYLRTPDAPARTRARDAVADTIRRHRPHVVIAHSLGSVVAYEALWAYPELDVDLLLTVGSPLGMTGVVCERLVPSPVAPVAGRPPTVRWWVNIADPGDIVAIPRPFTRRFRPDEDHEDEHIHWLDFHSARRYLSAATTARVLRRYARSLDIAGPDPKPA